MKNSADNDFVLSENGVFLVTIDPKVYSLDSLLKTAYWYTDRCYLHLQFSDSGNVEVRLKPKSGANISPLAETFMNDLLNQSLRERIAKESEAFKNVILAHALSKTSLVSPELEVQNPFEDPKKIALPDDAKGSKV